MSLIKFSKDDIYVNTMKTSPSVKFTIHDGSIFYRDDFATTVNKGNAALFDINLGVIEPTEEFYALQFNYSKNSFYIPYL
jgi:hypothetical protein